MLENGNHEAVSAEKPSKLQERFLKIKAREETACLEAAPPSCPGGTSRSLLPGTPPLPIRMRIIIIFFQIFSVSGCAWLLTCVLLIFLQVCKCGTFGKSLTCPLTQSRIQVNFAIQQQNQATMQQPKATVHSVGVTVKFSPSFFYPSSPSPLLQGAQ